MSIILKRGLESNRSGLSLQQGEPIFTTDTKRMYVGASGSVTGVELSFGQLTASFISASIISASLMYVDTLDATTIIGSIESASYALTASYALNSIVLPSGIVSSSAQVDYSLINNKPTSIDTASYVSLDADLIALADNISNGLWARTGTGTGTTRVISGTANQVTVVNGGGVSGNPTLSLPQSIATTSTPQFAKVGIGLAADLTASLSVGGPVILGSSIFNNHEIYGNVVVSPADGGGLSARGSHSAAMAMFSAQRNDYTASYCETLIKQYGTTATGTTAGIGHANLGALCFINTAGGVIATNGDTPLYLGTADTTRLTIDATGNVGIGTATPAAQLVVSKNTANVLPISGSIVNIVGSDGSGLPVRLTIDSAGNNSGDYSGLVFRKSRGTIASPSPIAGDEAIGIINAMGANSSGVTPATSIAAISFRSSQAFSAGSAPTYMAFYTTPSGSVLNIERARLDSAGNLGIGDSPSTAYSSARRIVDIAGDLGVAGNGGLLQVRSSENDTQGYFYATSGSGISIGSRSAHNFTIKTNSVDRMYVLTNGNVGIGTATPSASFHVTGSTIHGISTTSTHTFTGSLLVTGSVSLVVSSSTGANTASLNNSPVSGNPTGWITINVNGTDRKMPYW